MVKLSSFFKNPFLDKRLSYANKQRFSEMHIGCLMAQNTGGAYSAMLAATVAVHTDFFGDFTDTKIKSAFQQSQTQVVEELITAFVNRTSRLNHHLIGQEIDKLPLYEEFFPQGVLEFTRYTTKANAGSHIDRMLTAVTNHTAEAGGAAVLAEYTAFQTNYKLARKSQLEKIGDTGLSRSSRNQKGVLWAEQLFSNLLTIANQFQSQPNRVRDFFDQSALHGH